MFTMKTSYVAHVLLLNWNVFHVIAACKGTSLNPVSDSSHFCCSIGNVSRGYSMDFTMSVILLHLRETDNHFSTTDGIYTDCSDMQLITHEIV